MKTSTKVINFPPPPNLKLQPLSLASLPLSTLRPVKRCSTEMGSSTLNFHIQCCVKAKFLISHQNDSVRLEEQSSTCRNKQRQILSTIGKNVLISCKDQIPIKVLSRFLLGTSFCAFVNLLPASIAFSSGLCWTILVAKVSWKMSIL